MRLRIYGPARRDIENAYDHISRDNPGAARRVAERILNAVERLEEHPFVGRPGRVEGTRELVISRTPYIAVYVVDGETVAVVRIIHGRQRWPPADDEA